MAGSVGPGIGFGIKAEETHREGGAAADGAVRCRGKAHHVGTFARIGELRLGLRAGGRVFNDQNPVDQVAALKALAIREVLMEEALCGCDDGLCVLLAPLPDLFPITAVEFVPTVLRVQARGAVDLTVEIPVHVRVGLASLPLGENGPRLAALGVQNDDLAGGAAHAKVDPAPVIGSDAARVLSPILEVHVSVVSQFAGGWIIADHATVRIRGGPDASGVILGHAHRHLRLGLLREGEGAGDGVELAEMAVEVRVEPVSAGQDGGVGAVSTRREGHLDLAAVPGLCVDAQQGIAAAVVEQPQQDDVPSGSVNCGHGATVVTDGRGYTVVVESVSEFFSDRGAHFLSPVRNPFAYEVRSSAGTRWCQNDAR